MKMESFTEDRGQGAKSVHRAAIGRLDGDTGPRGRVFVTVSRRGPGSLIHERMRMKDKMCTGMHPPRKPSFAARSNANDPNETVLTLVRLSMIAP